MGALVLGCWVINCLNLGMVALAWTRSTLRERLRVHRSQIHGESDVSLCPGDSHLTLVLPYHQ